MNKRIIDPELIAPAWDEKHGGVYVPLLNIVIQPYNLRNEKADRYLPWKEAMDLAAAQNITGDNKVSAANTRHVRLFTRDEAYVILWQKDAINAILEEHGGEPLDNFFWSSSEYSSISAWGVGFSSGNVNTGNKYLSIVARAVVAL